MRMLLGGGGAARVRSCAVHWRMVERRPHRCLSRGRSGPVRMRMLLGGGGVRSSGDLRGGRWSARRCRRTGCSASTRDDGRARATGSVRMRMLLGGGAIGRVSGCIVHCRVLGAGRSSGDVRGRRWVGEEVQTDGVLCLTAWRDGRAPACCICVCVWACRRTGSVRTRMLLGGVGVGRVCGCIVYCWVLGGGWSSGDVRGEGWVGEEVRRDGVLCLTTCGDGRACYALRGLAWVGKTGDEGLTGDVRGCAVRCWPAERRAARCGGLTG
ncbi:hypothetical protein JB92DRAFT_2861416 [Gautieria morchelliformis]|nr:hypothetical protein JB92DRAFT_2861416 [Gautieria morchelliformis]